MLVIRLMRMDAQTGSDSSPVVGTISFFGELARQSAPLLAGYLPHKPRRYATTRSPLRISPTSLASSSAHFKEGAALLGLPLT